MSNLPALTAPVYATDEDIAVRAGGDFITLCPQWQQMAAGTDGVFAPGAPWVLTSALVDFGANGVKPNHVVHLTVPKPNFPGGGILLAIDAVNGGSITVRRLYKDNGVGQPPAPSVGLTAVAFNVPTLDPQTASASFDIKRRWGIDEGNPARSSASIYDLQDLRTVTVLTVLLTRYVQEARGDRGDFPRKIGLTKDQLTDATERVAVRWGAQGNSQPPTTLWDQRLKR